MTDGPQAAERVLPVPDEASAPYWAACAEHVLKLPRCSQCREFTFPPDITCPNCHSLEPAYSFEEVSGKGSVRTWTVIRHSFLKGFGQRSIRPLIAATTSCLGW